MSSSRSTGGFDSGEEEGLAPYGEGRVLVAVDHRAGDSAYGGAGEDGSGVNMVSTAS